MFAADTTVLVEDRRSHLLVVAVGQGPVLLGGMEQQAQHVEGEAVLLETPSFIGADEDAALKLRICQHHDLREGESQGVMSDC